MFLAGCGQTRWVTTDSKGLSEMRQQGYFNQRRYLAVRDSTIEDAYGAYLVVQVTDSDYCVLVFSTIWKMEKAYKTFSEKGIDVSKPAPETSYGDGEIEYRKSGG